MSRASCALLVSCAIAAQAALAHAQPTPTASAASPPSPAVKGRDGQHDFDFHMGTWKTHLWRRPYPFTESTPWIEYAGTTVVRKVWNGRANLVELEVDGPPGHLEGLSLRLYNPQARQWSLNYSNSKSGTMALPVIGEFKNGRGEFYGPDSVDGRAIYVRFIISVTNPNSVRFEQSFSDDGGKTWVPNWIAIDTRVEGKSDQAS